MAYHVVVRGLVQGVGFRPFVYRIARRNGIAGSVENRVDGVFVRAEGTPERLSSFLAELRQQAPPASEIEELEVYSAEPTGARTFRIEPSTETAGRITRISPDLAVCDDCLADIRHQTRRLAYPFVNCTNCGPRFSIVLGIPYDRSRTTMAPFRMCDACRKEYEDILDRRFHAQPNACRECGPSYVLRRRGTMMRHADSEPADPGQAVEPGEPQFEETHDIERILLTTAALLESGAIVAMKGLGGFHIACDPRNREAVARLRRAKKRDGKPFALMFRDMDAVRAVAHTTPEEEALLGSVRRPIVLLPMRTAGQPGARRPAAGAPAGPDTDGRVRRRPGLLPGDAVSGLHTVGVMLPYMPFHHLLFERMSLSAIVLTSGNLHDEPIVTGNREAVEKLTPVTDALLLYNRGIANRVDDSVAAVVNGRPRLIRRSRGYVPTPIRTRLPADGILAVGADMKSCFCFGPHRGGRQWHDHQAHRGNDTPPEHGDAVLSQHIGELEHPETLSFFRESLGRLCELFQFEPELLVRDMHPDYVSTQFAERYAEEKGLPLVPVQHHHAHVAACMAEHDLDGPVIGVSMDGTGYGEDGAIWGGEFLICDLADYRRVVHLEYVPLPGGEKAIREPWRMALAYLHAAYGGSPSAFDLIDRTDEGLLTGTDRASVAQAIEKGINAPSTSSAGRLFDAVSAILGLCRNSTFEAEAPMRLEACAAGHIRRRSVTGSRSSRESAAEVLPELLPAPFPYELGAALSFLPTIRSLVEELRSGADRGLIAARFHSTMVDAIRAAAIHLREREGLNRVVCSGGLFQNRLILAATENLLATAGFEVFTHERVPSNDGGIALGQLAVAAGRRVRDVSGSTR